MKFSEFITKYTGKKVDYDKAFGAQCVDLFRQFCKDVLNIPHTGSVDGAKDLYLKYDKLPTEKKYFVALPPSQIRMYGDVIIYGETSKNVHGHVALYIGDVADKTLAMEQDGLKQDGAKVTCRSTDNIIGILRFRDRTLYE